MKQSIGQLNLLDRGAGYRATDPPSSRRAAGWQDSSGRRAGDKARVMVALGATPGLSSRALAERHGLDRYMVARRLPDLRAGRLARSVEPAAGDGSDVIWFPMDEEEGRR